MIPATPPASDPRATKAPTQSSSASTRQVTPTGAATAASSSPVPNPAISPSLRRRRRKDAGELTFPHSADRARSPVCGGSRKQASSPMRRRARSKAARAAGSLG
jgi:hypothetical protein